MNQIEYALEIKNLNKIFDEDSGIKDISFGIKKGSFHLLIGANGAGKTTLIRTILRIYKNYSGSIKINGVPNTNKHIYKHINYISELPIFPSELNSREFLMWAGRMAGYNDNDIKSDIDRISKNLKINHLLDKKPTRFSSGQKQKIMLMKILIEKSDILIMDEPTANLDPSARIVFFDEIEKINKLGKTIFISSHNLDEVERKATWVTVMNKGNIVYDDKKGKSSLMNIFKKYVHESDGV